MQWTRLWIVALVLPLAGCLTDSQSVEPTTPVVTPAPKVPPPLPAAIKDAKMVVAGLDPFNFVTGVPCSQPVSACYLYPFTVDDYDVANSTGNVSIDAKLMWTIPANDFDLYVFKEGDAAPVTMSAGSPPATEEAIAAELDGPGNYQLIVVAWAAVADTYTVEATFSST